MICKEAMHNILKHSDAHHASIQFIKGDIADEDTLTVVVVDNGKGMDLTHVSKSNGNGIDNINKRIGRLGGQMSIKENHPSGTIINIRVKIPWPEGVV